MQLQVFVRESHHGNPPHVIHLAGDSLTPADWAHPCSCAAGAEGRACWALKEVLAYEAPKLSDRPDVLERAELARESLEHTRLTRQARHD